MAASEPVPVVAFSAEAMWDNVVASMKLEESDASKETAESDSSTTVCDTAGSTPIEKRSISDGERDTHQDRSEDDQHEASQESTDPEVPGHLTGFKLVTVCVSVMLAVLCIALDNTSQLLSASLLARH